MNLTQEVLLEYLSDITFLHVADICDRLNRPDDLDLVWDDLPDQHLVFLPLDNKKISAVAQATGMTLDEAEQLLLEVFDGNSLGY